MKRVLMLATTVAMIEQFNKSNIELLNDMGYIVDVAGNFQKGNPISKSRIEEFQTWIKIHNGKWYDIPLSRNPIAFRANLKAYRFIVSLLREETYDFIHVHTPIGSMIGRLAAHRTHVQIIYTAHGFHFFRGAPIKNWLFYYPIEWLCSWWTDTLITINQEDYNRASSHMHAKITEYVMGVGIDSKQIQNISVNRAEYRKWLGLEKEDILIISTGELNANKNHEVIIRALHQLKDPRLHYVICGQGEKKDDLEKLIHQFNLGDHVRLLGFRNDAVALLKCSDIFAFPSKREGLSVALMEAMSAGLPVICSDIRGNADLISDSQGGYRIQEQSVSDYAEAIYVLSRSKESRRKMGQYNIRRSYDLDRTRINQKMRKIYSSFA